MSKRLLWSGSGTPGNVSGVKLRLQYNPAASVTTFYVDAANPSAGNGTQANPFKTIQAGINAATSNYQVLVAGGNYTELVTIAGKTNLTLRAVGSSYGTWPVTITGSSTRNRCIFVNGTNSNIIIDGFKVTLCTIQGIYCQGPNISNVEIMNCYALDCGGSGISGWGVPFGTNPVPSNWRGIQVIRVHHNKVERCCNAALFPSSGFNEQITIANGIYDFKVYNNEVGPSLNGANYSAVNGGEGIDFKEGCEFGEVFNNKVFDIEKNGIYLDAGRSNTLTGGYTAPGFMRNVHIYNNLVYGIRQQGGISVTSEARLADSAADANGRLGGSIQDIFIDYNTVYGCNAAGILLYDYGLIINGGFTSANVPLCSNVQIVNNISHGNAVGGNNAYSGINHDHGWATGSVIKKNNSTGSFSGVHVTRGTPAVNTGNVNSDPLFTSPAAGDFTLQNGSPAIDLGGDAVTTPTGDFTGGARVVGTKADAGAFEKTLSNWIARSTGAGVMWAHNFATAAEVNAFCLPNDQGVKDPNTRWAFDADRNKNVLEFVIPGSTVVNVTNMTTAGTAAPATTVRVTTAAAHNQAVGARALFNGLTGQWSAFNDASGGGGGVTDQFNVIAVGSATVFDINTQRSTGGAPINATGFAAFTAGGTVTTARVNNQSWLRPFSVFAAGVNGQSTGDIGARDGHPVRTVWDNNDFNEAYNYCADYFGHPTYQASQSHWVYQGIQVTNVWRGNDFWVQFRGKIGPASRWVTTMPGGKFLSPTTANTTATHELVIRSTPHTNPAYNAPDYNTLTAPFQMYTAAGASVDLVKNIPGVGGDGFSSGGAYELTCGFYGGQWHGPCWYWTPDEWTVFLIHVVPGLDGANGGLDPAAFRGSQPNGTLIQVWAARQSELGAGYVKILDNRWGIVYDKGSAPTFPFTDNGVQITGPNPFGWNALWLAGYMNNAPAATQFYHRFDEIILKKGNGGNDPNIDGIACPTS